MLFPFNYTTRNLLRSFLFHTKFYFYTFPIDFSPNELPFVTLFQNILHQTNFRLVLKQSKKFNRNPNFVWNKKFP